ncbi:MAG: VWA domain-containing protein [Leptospira sp.]|nr:VWA domain-containing protein [Leptospira sp.]
MSKNTTISKYLPKYLKLWAGALFFRSNIVIFFSFFVIFLYGCSYLHSQSTPNKRYVIVLDASGSMAERWDGKTRMAVVKDKLNVLLDKMGKDTSVGLVAYGNRIAGCSSARLYQPIQRGSAELVKQKLNGIVPAGSTPIAQTLGLVGEYLLSDTVTTEILFVSDGVESCEGDPKEILYKLRALGKKFNLHILGIDIDPKGEEDLKRLAVIGDGRYFSIKETKDYQISFLKLFPEWETDTNFVLNHSFPQKSSDTMQEKQSAIRIVSILPYSGIEENQYILTYEYESDKNIDHMIQFQLFPKEEKAKAFPIPELRERRMGDLYQHNVDLQSGKARRGRIRFQLDSKKRMNASVELWELSGIPKIIAISEEKPVQSP